MHSTSRNLATAHGFAEKRSEYSDNSRARTAPASTRGAIPHRPSPPAPRETLGRSRDRTPPPGRTCPTSPRLAHVAFLYPRSTNPRHLALGANVGQQGGPRVLPGNLGKLGAAGTVAPQYRVCFACPDFRNAQRGNELRELREDE